MTLCSTCESFDLDYGSGLGCCLGALVHVDTYRKDAHVVELVQEQCLMFPPDLVVWREKLVMG